MKKFLCLVLSLITVVTLISCSKKDDSDIPTGMVIGKQTSSYTLYRPDGWIIQPELNGIVLAYASTADKSSVSFSCVSSPIITPLQTGCYKARNKIRLF